MVNTSMAGASSQLAVCNRVATAYYWHAHCSAVSRTPALLCLHVLPILGKHVCPSTIFMYTFYVVGSLLLQGYIGLYIVYI